MLVCASVSVRCCTSRTVILTNAMRKYASIFWYTSSMLPQYKSIVWMSASYVLYMLNKKALRFSKCPGTKATKHHRNAAPEMTTKFCKMYTMHRKCMKTFHNELSMRVSVKGSVCVGVLCIKFTIIYWCTYTFSELICSLIRSFVLYCCIVTIFDTL